MLEKLIHRPIAVTMIVIALVVMGVLSLQYIPVSLMPQVDIPRITIQMAKPGASVTEIERQLVRPMRQQLTQVAGLKDIESRARMDAGTITLTFEPGTNMDLLFIDVNEKVDRAMNSFDRSVQRPKIVKASAMDIPAFYVDIRMADSLGSSQSDPMKSGQQLAQLSKLVRNVISKRIEQVPEVAMVDFSGTVGAEIVCVPDMDKLAAMGMTEADIENTIKSNNITLSALSVVSGIYRYSIHFDAQILTREDVENLYIRHGDRLMQLKDVCHVEEKAAVRNGVVKHQGSDAVTMAVIKQNDAQMATLQEHIQQLVNDLKKDYQGIDIQVNRDQTELLSYSISNLEWNFVLGALLASVILFLFNGGWRMPLLIVISIPLSLVLTLLSFYLLHISINVISLSGLILGVGMMVDNAIIVIDNIRQRGHVVNGTKEVFFPMLSGVLTTCSVFIPLIFLNGTTGALFYDQAMGVTVALFASLLVAVLVIPVYYHALFFWKKRKKTAVQDAVTETTGQPRQKETRGERILRKWYAPWHRWTLRHGGLMLASVPVLVVLTVVLFPIVKKERMPFIEHEDAVMTIDWNAGISVDENDRRTQQLMAVAGDRLATFTSMAGTQEFVLSHTPDITSSEAVVYLKADSKEKLEEAKQVMGDYLAKHHPKAKVDYAVSGNVYDAIFQTDRPDLEIRLQKVDGGRPTVAAVRDFIVLLHRAFPEVGIQPVAVEENMQFVADLEQLALYRVTYQQLYARLTQLLGSSKVYEISIGSQIVPILVGQDSRDVDKVMAETIVNNNGTAVPIAYLVKEKRVENFKRLFAGKDGDFYPVRIDRASDSDVRRIVDFCNQTLEQQADGNAARAMKATYHGNYYEARAMIRDLAVVLLVSLMLLYFILAAQFESLLQPLIILSEIVVDVCVVVLVLLLCGESLNIMSMTGLVVMSGIVINDSILKVDTINRLYRSGQPLLRAVTEAGHRRLKPIVMTSLTTILALLPFLHRGDMGSALQYPLSLTLIVGMVVGTIVSLYGVPLVYRIVMGEGRKRNLKHRKKTI